ncbi:MAG: UDP-N-acetylglucosamine 1-carboxyvinyltransferase [Clostridia bacterium]|nr:UDP-N-acetylglucosamine 1-carboxyvinyltransferase [Clostridia bacterium]
MEKLVVRGGKRLCGEVTISGAKNAAVAIIPAALLVDGICIVENVPAIKDVAVICSILEELGAKIDFLDKYTIKIDCSNVNKYTAPYEKVRKMRASYYLLGALLGRVKKADVALPGGCNFGSRPIDQHLKGFKALGAKVSDDPEIEKSGIVYAATDGLVGTNVYLDVVSVGATINVMLAATLARGTTIIENVAKEPHIVDVANFLNAMGANIKGAGTDVIRIHGVDKLHGGTYSIIPDQIEAGTFMVAAAATGGDILVKNVIPKHMESVSAKLEETGATVKEFDDSIRVIGTGTIKPVNIKTLPYPGFPTDMQPQFVSLLAAADGTSIVTESVWESRFQYVDELMRMGADITVCNRTATIKGTGLCGTQVRATDLRGGAGMVIAGLMADGETTITDIQYIDRGYENMEEKFRNLGADINRVNDTRIDN